MSADLRRPEASEYAPYFSRYIDLVPDGAIVDTLTYQLGETLRLLQGVSLERETYRYAPDKWSIREVIGHLVDVERVFAFRAIAIARADGVDLPSMEQDEWAAHSNANDRALDDLMGEWANVRRATIHMFATLPDGAGGR
ncbi:MAG: DinB family protein, partial [Longimicrobiales bacterium]